MTPRLREGVGRVLAFLAPVSEQQIEELVQEQGPEAIGVTSEHLLMGPAGDPIRWSHRTLAEAMEALATSDLIPYEWIEGSVYTLCAAGESCHMGNLYGFCPQCRNTGLVRAPKMRRELVCMAADPSLTMALLRIAEETKPAENTRYGLLCPINSAHAAEIQWVTRERSPDRRMVGIITMPLTFYAEGELTEGIARRR